MHPPTRSAQPTCSMHSLITSMAGRNAIMMHSCIIEHVLRGVWMMLRNRQRRTTMQLFRQQLPRTGQTWMNWVSSRHVPNTIHGQRFVLLPVGIGSGAMQMHAPVVCCSVVRSTRVGLGLSQSMCAACPISMR